MVTYNVNEGNWFPTAELRIVANLLQQKWRRYPEGGHGTVNEEWREVPYFNRDPDAQL